MDDNQKVEALGRLLDDQLGKVQQTREIELKLNIALWTAIVIAGGFLYQHGLRLDTWPATLLYVAVGVAVYLAHSLFWLFPIQYSEDNDEHYIIEYRKAIGSSCGFNPKDRQLGSCWRRYARWRETGWPWVLAQSWMTAVLLVLLGFLLAFGPRQTQSGSSPNPGVILAWASTLHFNVDHAALVVAVLAFGVAIWQAYLQRKAMRLQIFENTFRDIRDREATFTERYVVPLTDLNGRLQTAQDSGEISSQIRSLAGIRHVTAFGFFNTIEYLAFLINNGFVGDRRLESFFAPAILFWYEELFRKHDPEAEQNPEQYEEFKKLYLRLKGEKQ